MDNGVLQGSVLGSFCFSVYSLHLGKITTADQSGTKYQFWVNDSQLDLIFESSEADAANDNMETLIKDITQWFIAIFMYKNDTKDREVNSVFYA